MSAYDKTSIQINRCKRILALVDDYMEKQDAATRTDLRKALMEEFEAPSIAPPVAAGSVDTEALRKLALAATPGDQWRMNNDGAQFGLRVNSGYQGFFNHQRPNQKCTDEVFANVAYILAAKPSVVLALIERAEKAESALAAALVLPVSIPDGEVRYITDSGIMNALDRVLGAAPAVQDAKALVDIATAVMSEHGLIDHLSESNTQKFCDALCAAIATRGTA